MFPFQPHTQLRPSPFPNLLGSETFKVFFEVCPGLPFIPEGPARNFGRTIMKLRCPRVPGNGWMDGPISPLLSARFPSAPFLVFHTSPPSSSQRDAPSPAPPSPPSARLYPLPGPGQADAIGASSLRDPALYLSLVSPLPDTSFKSLSGPPGLSANWVDAQFKTPQFAPAIGLRRERRRGKNPAVSQFSANWSI